jgi:hypothetical protein
MNKINRQMDQVEGKLDEIERRANKIKIAIDEMGAKADESDQADRSASDQAIEGVGSVGPKAGSRAAGAIPEAGAIPGKVHSQTAAAKV